MNIAIFDTETTSLEKPFCYNIGYQIVNVETKEVLLKREFVVEQVWHNIPLFSSAYYADKRPLYVSAMKGKRAVLEKWGYACGQMRKDFKTYEVSQAYAYNSAFDEKVFEFNTDYFKTLNPFDELEIFDIRGYVHKFIAFTPQFQDFCEINELFTESGNYSTTAETLFRYLSQNIEFNEAHTALADSEIETQILFMCLDKGAEIGKAYKTYQSIPRKVERTLTIATPNGETVYTYTKRRNASNGTKIILS